MGNIVTYNKRNWTASEEDTIRKRFLYCRPSRLLLHTRHLGLRCAKAFTICQKCNPKTQPFCLLIHVDPGQSLLTFFPTGCCIGVRGRKPIDPTASNGARSMSLSTGMPRYMWSSRLYTDSAPSLPQVCSRCRLERERITKATMASFHLVQEALECYQLTPLVSAFLHSPPPKPPLT